MKNKRLHVNIFVSLLSQLLTMLCGFLLPRFMLVAYGSDVNGLITSISQFLGFISFLQFGLGAVVQSTLYKPLAEKDWNKVSEVYVSAQRFFRKIAVIFVGYVLILFVVYPRINASAFDSWFIVLLISILSINLFAQYYFGIVNQLLLTADQKAYIPLGLDVITVLLNTLTSIVLIHYGMPVQGVKLVSALIFLLRPLVLAIYVKKMYMINRRVKYFDEPIKQKWNGFAQHLSSTIMDNTDVMVLTFFSTMGNVSIYHVYNMIAFGIRQFIISASVGIQSFFGNLLANESPDEVRGEFEFTEAILHYVITLLFVLTAILIVPFVRVYTLGITDADYNVPLFAFILVLAQCFYCYKSIYYIIIKAAGHYKQTQCSAIIEMVINLGVSVLCVVHWGLIGVAIGTFIANVYRTGYFAKYLSGSIIKIRLRDTVIRFLTDIMVLFITFLATSFIKLEEVSYWGWVMMAVKVIPCCILISIVINMLVSWLFYPKILFRIKKKICRN